MREFDKYLKENIIIYEFTILYFLKPSKKFKQVSQF